MNAAELFVRCLENEGIDMIFGIPGEENLDVMDPLLESTIRFITTRHEQGAAFMVDVYRRLTLDRRDCLTLVTLLDRVAEDRDLCDGDGDDHRENDRVLLGS